MSRLSGQQVKQLQQCLLSSFNFDELSRIVQFELNEQFASIAPPGTMSTATFELVMWAERTGRTAELIKAVMAARPNSPDMAALSQLLPAQAGTPAAPAVSAADQQRRLRGALLDQFPRPADLTILVADALGENIDQVAGGANQTEVCFNLVQWLWVDKPGRLQLLLARAMKERPNNAELKALKQELDAA
ncbi:effector-associated domain EAD1-containing protein [Gemmata sp. JC673]|uniref:Effector-associated domain EAD1-containing protein n=1 Tax=Gemmata algarum TaxID=2975278 RepID=A0ABU5ET66_9BACT|nr:effector-associated domain EAD1-containing protein [Gemmata algarum]MDY3558400.1 effector-associated domain EAD1-containing protein [Gemmata algarum]